MTTYTRPDTDPTTSEPHAARARKAAAALVVATSFGLTAAGVVDAAISLLLIGLAFAFGAGPDDVPTLRRVARTRRNAALAVVAAAACVLLALVPQLTPVILALPGSPDLVMLGIFLMAAYVMGAPLLMTLERPKGDETTAFVLGRRNFVLAATGLVAFTFAHVSGQMFLALAATAFVLPVVLAVRRVRRGRRGDVETHLLRAPFRADLRPHLLQAINHTVLWGLVAVAVLPGTFDMLRADLGSDGYPVFLAVLVAGLAGLVLLAFFPLRRTYLATNLLVAFGSVFLAVQLAVIYAPAGGAVTIDPPMSGEWYVAQGGHAELVNYHHIAQAQHDAMDLVQMKDGSTHRGDGAELEDYYAFGQVLFAPANGVVTSATDGLRDEPIGSLNLEQLEGNHVVIDLGDGTYLVLAHLQQGSLLVAEGDIVRVGQPLGLVGNSGNSDQPHVHLQIQNRPALDAVHPMPGLETMPVLFRDTFVTRHGTQTLQAEADVRRGDLFRAQHPLG